MRTQTTIAEVRRTLSGWRARGQRIAFVPTLGNLHAGHLCLFEQASSVAGRVVASIFVNPLQFGENEDFLGYPRTLGEDNQKLKKSGVDLLFAPVVTEIYPQGSGSTTYVEVPAFSDILCGAFRPGHFRGVATVVNKLFNIVQPDVALFGEKDYQQLQVIRRMVADLRMPIEIVDVATVREADGLAMSSRNAYLGTNERRRAPNLYQALCAARERIQEGGRNFTAIEADGLETLRQGGFRPDYFSVRRAEDLAPAGADDADLDLVILAAAWLGTARLIDNVRLELRSE